MNKCFFFFILLYFCIVITFIYVLLNSTYSYFYFYSRESDCEKREKIKNAMKNAWNSYIKYALGYDFLNPLMQAGENLHGFAYTVFDSLDSLLLMGLNDEYNFAVKWINESLEFDGKVSFFETVIRCLGGLLSAYEMTNDSFLLKTAKKLGDRLTLAFNTTTKLPRVLVNLKDGSLEDHSWALGATLLADAGSCQIEFLALTHHTGDPKYFELSMTALKAIALLGPIPPTLINYEYIFPLSHQYSLDSMSDSYFEYLLKMKLYAPKNMTLPGEFKKAIVAAIKRLGSTSVDEKYIYLGSAFSNFFSNEVTHLSYFLPGTLLLAAKEEKDPEDYSLYYNLAMDLLSSNIQFYSMTKTHLGYEAFKFMPYEPILEVTDDSYKLRPEYVESLFYWWRIAHDIRAKRLAWDTFESIMKYCFVNEGFTSINRLNSKFVIYNGIQDSYFLSETLKYLYLIFSDDNVFSIDDYVFNTQAHPFKKLKF